MTGVSHGDGAARKLYAMNDKMFSLISIKRFGLCLAGLCFSALAHAQAPTAASLADGRIDEKFEIPKNYKLVWADEFDKDGLPNPNNWGYDVSRNFQGWYNREQQYYSLARPENTRVEGGRLIIESRVEELKQANDWGGQPYTSGRLTGAGKQSWVYGAFEVRAKLACGRGLWPAIWLLPTSTNLPWPASGEIDIMEHVGHDEGVVHGTIHTGRYNHVSKTQKAGTVNLPSVCDQFHRYQLLWTNKALTFAIDDQAYFRFVNDGEGENATWPFDRRMHLILNTAIGGNWGGLKGIDEAKFPAKFEIDYVRVYQAPAASPK
jgi:beta-glucanase (GH16 family)